MERIPRNWGFPVLLVIVLAGVLLVRAWRPEGTRVEPVGLQTSPASVRSQVVLTIDFGEGEPRVLNASWRDGMTVQEALATSATAFRVHGSGEAAFLTELAGVKNEGAGGRNWQFEVNQKWSDRSFGVHRLKPGDHVLWKFAESE